MRMRAGTWLWRRAASCSASTARSRPRSWRRAAPGPRPATRGRGTAASAPCAPRRRGRRHPATRSSCAARDRGAEPAPDPVAVDRGAHPSPDGVRDPRGIGGSVVDEAQRDRTGPVAAEPERGPRRSHGRGRARSGREPLPATGSAGPQHGSPAARPHPECGNHGSWRACGCWAGTCVSRRGLLEEVTARTGAGIRGGRRSAQCTGAPTGAAMRGRVVCGRVGPSRTDLDPLSHMASRCYVSAPRSGLRPARCELPRWATARPGRTGDGLGFSPDLHTCGRSCGQDHPEGREGRGRDGGRRIWDRVQPRCGSSSRPPPGRRGSTASAPSTSTVKRSS